MIVETLAGRSLYRLSLWMWWENYQGTTSAIFTIGKCPAPGDLDIVQSVAGDGAGLHLVSSLQEVGDVTVGQEVGVLPAGRLAGLAGVVRHTALPLRHTILREGRLSTTGDWLRLTPH